MLKSKSKSKTRRRCRKSRRCKLSRRVKHRGGMHNTRHISKEVIRPGFFDETSGRKGPAPVPHPPRRQGDSAVFTQFEPAGTYEGRAEGNLVQTTIPLDEYMLPIKNYEEALKKWYLEHQTNYVNVLINKTVVNPNITSHHNEFWIFIKVQQTGLDKPTYGIVTHKQEPTIPQWPDDRWVTASLETIQALNRKNIFCFPENYEVMQFAETGGVVLST